MIWPCRITSRQAFVCSSANHKTWGRANLLISKHLQLNLPLFRLCKWLTVIFSRAPCLCVKSHYQQTVCFLPQSSIFPQTPLALLHHPSPNLQPCICPRAASPWRIIRSPHRGRQIEGERGGKREMGGVKEGGIQKGGEIQRKTGTMLWSLTPVAKGQCIKKPKAQNNHSGPFNKTKGTGRGFSVTHTQQQLRYIPSTPPSYSINKNIIAA